MREMVYTFYINDPDPESGIFGCVAQSEAMAEELARKMGYKDFFLANTRELEAHESVSFIDRSIRGNPFVGEQWLGVIKGIEVLIDERTFNRRNPTWTMQTYGHHYNLSPHSSPYVQAILEADGALHVELSGNIICEPPITESQMEQLEWVGWNRPPEDDPKLPNFFRLFEPGWHPRYVAERVVESLTSIMNIKEDDFFNFSENPDTIAKIAEIPELDRLKIDEGRNGNGSIFCLKGMHDDLIEEPQEPQEPGTAEQLRELLHPDFHVESTLLQPDLVSIITDIGEVFLQVFPWANGDEAVNIYTCVSYNAARLAEFRRDLAEGYNDTETDLDPLVGRWSSSDEGQIWFNVHLPLIAAKADGVLDTTVGYIVDTVTQMQPAIIARYGGAAIHEIG